MRTRTGCACSSALRPAAPSGLPSSTRPIERWLTLAKLAPPWMSAIDRWVRLGPRGLGASIFPTCEKMRDDDERR